MACYLYMIGSSGLMAQQRHLSKAPLTEAVIDFRVKLPQDFQVEQLSILQKKLLMAEREELKSLLMKVKEDSERLT